MSDRPISNSKSSNPNVLMLYGYVSQHIDSQTWESKENLELHTLLTTLTTNDWNCLVLDFSNWNEREQNIMSDCVAYGIGGRYEPPYTYEKRVLAQKLFSKMQNGFSHPDFKKWKENYKVNSKTQSQNAKVLSIYDFLLRHQYEDGDYWFMGGGSQEIQNRLNFFTDKDWEDLKGDILSWDRLEREILIESISYGFDGAFTSYLKEEMIPSAGEFLMDMFIHWNDRDNRIEIVENIFFINVCTPERKKDLIFIRDWILDNSNVPELERKRIDHINQVIKNSCR